MKTVKEKLYDFPAGGFCGVLMPKKVMVKVAKLQAKYALELREVLTEHADDLYASDWTLANRKDENGKILKQITIKYVDARSGEKLKRRIALYGPIRPSAVEEVYIVENMKHADEVAEAVLEGTL